LDASGSCSGRCFASHDSSKDCQCNTACENYGDCCSDYYSLCLGSSYSCANGRCGENYDSSNPCHCNDLCTNYGNCCGDYDDYCSGSPDSCSGRCGEDYDSTNQCHCNDQCKNYGNCCTDYDDHCSGGDLNTLFQALWDADVNRLEDPDLIVSRQEKLTDYSDRIDHSPANLFTYVNEAKLTGTWPSFMALLDNYNRFTGTQDTTTSNENQEIENFLDDIYSTEVMSLTTQYMIDNGYFASASEFRDYVKSIWFDLYTRSGGTIDSSGFEHTFVGEVKNGKVSGYHNWLAFYLDEQESTVNYYGYTSDNEPNQILMQFRLDEGNASYYKELASIIYGASPEFELAVFTACFVENPNTISTFTLNGHTQRVQTWDYENFYIGSAYFSV
ncbi:uridylate-specific endoribonuclease D-like, partial [Diadema antillarum]|uniref:uridylate-specific endoribonuclease D-like n=1 Tax=Diadema antillarum TaxID=105358 RepID=UPI003A88BE15